MHDSISQVWTEAASGGIEWDPPLPFVETTLPTFPVQVLPPWMGDYVVALAHALQTPVDMAAMISLGLVALPTSRWISVQVRPGWIEPTNLYVLVSARSGEHKSPTLAKLRRPIDDHEASEFERMRPIIERSRTQVAVAEERLKALRRRAAHAESESARDEATLVAEDFAEELAGLSVPTPYRLVVADATPEALALRLHEHGERLGLISAEAGPLEIIAGRYSDGNPNLEIYLQGHSGDHYVVDRIGREGFILRNPLLTVVVTVQPEVILGLAAKPGLRGRGLLARFLYCLPVSMVGRRLPAPDPVPLEVERAYAASMRAVLTASDAHVAGHKGDLHALSVASEAIDLLLNMKGAMEPRLAPGGDFAAQADWANKFPGAVARIAGVLHVADRAGCGKDLSVIDEETMVRALSIGDYLLAHAEAAFSLMGANPALEHAQHIVAWLRREGKQTVSRREIYRAFSSRFAKAKDTDPVLEVLVDRGYLREIAQPDGRPGRPSQLYVVNPLAALTKPTIPNSDHGSVISVRGEYDSGRERAVFPFGEEGP